jgi:serine protease
VDIEGGWWLDHVDLDRSKLVPIFNDSNPDLMFHGTSVLGILMATRNNVGGTGIAYGLQRVGLASHYRAADQSCGHVADAIAAALAQPGFGSGGIILLEVQRDLMPTEIDSCDRAAIACAVAQGVVVVEAAGNGGADISGLTGSGALIVGAAEFATVDVDGIPAASGPYHEHWRGTNYGTALACFAWGNCIYTTSFDLPPANPRVPTSTFVHDFGATSGAAAMIAGAAALVQGVRAKRGKPFLSPGDLRDLFGQYCTLQRPSEISVNHTPIGVMPNLTAMLAVL